MDLTHYTAAPFAFDSAYTYELCDHFKPSGLWLSVEDGSWSWKDWCEIGVRVRNFISAA